MLLLSALVFLIYAGCVMGKPNFIIMLMDDVSDTSVVSTVVWARTKRAMLNYACEAGEAGEAGNGDTATLWRRRQPLW